MKFEIYSDTTGTYRWRLLAANGDLVATAKETYTRNADAQRAVTALQLSVFIAKIVDGVCIESPHTP